MKKVILIFAVATVIVADVCAQWTTSGSNIYNTNTGNVGVGTTTPTGKFELAGVGSSVPTTAIVRNDGTNAFYLYSYYDVSYAHSTLVLRRARGTYASPANSVAGDRIGSIGANYYINGVYDGGAAMEFYVASTPSSTSYPAYIIFGTTSNGSNVRTERMRITESGSVGIGITAPSYRLHVNGSVGATSYVTVSDARLKTNIQKLDQPLDKIAQLQGYTYSFKKGEKTERVFPEGQKIGLLAQEVEKVFPEAVYKDNEGYLGVDYNSLIPPMLEAIKTLKTQMDFTKELVQAKILSTRQEMAVLEEQGFSLKQNYPNPASQGTSIVYKMPSGTTGVIAIHSLDGKPVKTITDIAPGGGVATLSAADIKPGLYLYSLIVDGEIVATKKMVVE